MTDTRLPEHYLTSPTFDALTSDAFRVYVNGLMWSVTHGTDGALTRQALRWLNPDPLVLGPATAELVAVGLWVDDVDGWCVVGFLDYQTPAADVKAGRSKWAATKRRQRAHARDDHSMCGPDNCDKLAGDPPKTVPLDTPPLSGVDNTRCPYGIPECRLPA